MIEWTRRSVPRGLRLVLGLLLIGGGVLGFLPILGFWMIPLGIAVAALDVRPLSQALMALMRWRKLRYRKLWPGGLSDARKPF